MNLATDLEPEVPKEEIDAASAEAAEQQEQEKPEVKQEERPEKEKVVPHQALHEERERRKELQRQLEQERQQRAAFEAVTKDRLSQLFQASQAAQPQFIDPRTVENPVDAIQHNQQLTVQQINEMRQALANDAAQKQLSQQQSRLIGWAQQQAAEFKRETPDFEAAYDHVKKVRLGQLQALGLPPQEIAQAIYNDELWVFQHAAQTGRNPAEVLYRMAEQSGYKPGTSPEQKIETLQKGTQAAKTLGAGSADAGWPTAEQIANMPEEEFDALKRKLAKNGKNLSDIL